MRSEPCVSIDKRLQRCSQCLARAPLKVWAIDQQSHLHGPFLALFLFAQASATLGTVRHPSLTDLASVTLCKHGKAEASGMRRSKGKLLRCKTHTTAVFLGWDKQRGSGVVIMLAVLPCVMLLLGFRWVWNVLNDGLLMLTAKSAG